MKMYKKLLLIFLSLYPIFCLKIFYNSYLTLLQTLIIVAFLIWIIILKKLTLKDLKYLILYFVFIFIYIILHHINALNFTSLVPNNFDYDLIKELLYIYKLCMPVIFVFILKHIDFKEKDYKCILKSWILFISLTIIITNIFEISYGSYTGEFIKGNIFDWFNSKYSYKELASCGLFMYANQISIYLVCLVPIIMYYIFNKKLNIIYIILVIISSLMLGTRVSSVGLILVLIASYIINLFNKNKCMKYCYWFILIIILSSALLVISPGIRRYNTSTSMSIKYLSNAPSDKLDYIKNNYEEKQIYEYFIINSYPYQYDPDFWIDIMHKPVDYRTSYRYLEKEMVNRVVKINDNYFDKLFGITNTRIQNIFNIEQNYTLEYYAYGIIGTILFLGIYIYLYIKCIINFIKYKNLYSLIILSSSTLILIIPYLTGNIFNQISIFIPLLFMMNMSNKVYKKDIND